jgi:SAM-dependent methyltransferase
VVDWGLGNYERIAQQLLPVSEVVVDTADPVPGETLVDVGCGTGNAALLAAERRATVIGVDPSQRLLEVAAADAERRDLDAEFVLGEGASMPISAAEADVVVSVFGVIFADDPVAAASEIARVTKSSGRVIFSAWIPGGPISDAIRLARNTVTEILDEPPSAPPFAWHEREPVAELFEPHGFSLSLTEHPISFSAPSIDEFMRIEGENHPIAIATQPMLERAGRADEVRAGMRRIYEKANEDSEGLRITSRYAIAELTR